MAYSNYKTLKQVAEKFGLEVTSANLFKNVNPVQPSDWLVQTLEIAKTLPSSNEKSKSERFISPILLDIYNAHKDTYTLFSGEELNVDPKNDLNGPCDFFFVKKRDAVLLEAPVVSFTEAKKEDMDYGVAQCTAQMVGAQKFNQEKGKPISIIWGCSTTAGEWKFLKLVDKNLYVDKESYFVDTVDVLLGVFHQIFKHGG